MNVNINDNSFKVKLCMTENSIKEGMARKRFNEDFNGMLFLMGTSKRQSFWMFDCIIPLDIIFINGNKITSIFHNCPPCKVKSNCKHYEGFGDKVLEIAGGSCKLLNIKEDDTIEFNFN